LSQYKNVPQLHFLTFPAIELSKAVGLEYKKIKQQKKVPKRFFFAEEQLVFLEDVV
jgi:hypothetical protein